MYLETAKKRINELFINNNRFEIRIGKFGLYIIDTYLNEDLSLDRICDILNDKNKLNQM